MVQSLSQKPMTTFTQGLITEASELTFPENASVDELNCALLRDGSRRRRLGMVYEDNYVLSDGTYSEGGIVTTGDWRNVGGRASLEYLVVQNASTLVFYNKADTPLSGQEVTESDVSSTVYTLDLSAYEVVGSSGASSVRFQFTSINGALVVASEATDTIYIERDNTDGTFTVTTIDFKVRDFEWQGDTSTYYDELATGSLTTAREYDTANAGWDGTKGAAALVTYESANTAYPALTHPWYSGKDASGDFDEAEWQKVYTGTTLTANGHFILDLFNKDRSTASGIAGITTEVETSRFSVIETFSGRVFYSGLDSAKHGSKVYFSKLIEDLNELGVCHQVNDPTSEEISDLLDTDGGFILLPDAHGIHKLAVYGASLLVFAENGVWQIRGVDGVFRATEYSVSRVSNAGLFNPLSFVSADGTPFWWSNIGIHTITQDQVTGAAEEINVSLPSIQTFFDNIPKGDRSVAIAAYDQVNKIILWMYPSSDETISGKLNQGLLLNLPLQAFYPWKISDKTSSSPYVVGMSYFSGVGASSTELDVITSVGDDVVTSAGDDVVSTQVNTVYDPSTEIKFLVRDATNSKLTVSTTSSETFLDWGTANYSSYADAGHNFMGDMLLQKTIPYLTVYSKVTETGWTGDETNGYDPVRESSLLVSAYWDFRTSPSSTAQQAYRLKPVPVVDPDDLTTFGYPQTVVTTRLKLRGRGRSVRLRFESEQGKDFHLLGYDELGSRNTAY